MAEFIIGLWIGAIAGYFTCALMVIAKESGREYPSDREVTLEDVNVLRDGDGNPLYTHNNIIEINKVRVDDGPLTVSKPTVDSDGGVE